LKQRNRRSRCCGITCRCAAAARQCCRRRGAAAPPCGTRQRRGHRCRCAVIRDAWADMMQCHLCASCAAVVASANVLAVSIATLPTMHARLQASLRAPLRSGGRAWATQQSSLQQRQTTRSSARSWPCRCELTPAGDVSATRDRRTCDVCCSSASAARLLHSEERPVRLRCTARCLQAELAAVMLANRAAVIPLIPKALADLPAQREAAAHRDACAAFVRDYHMVRYLAGLFETVRFREYPVELAPFMCCHSS
jgi:hypothetical protein